MSYPRPIRDTSHLVCPGCWCNALAETLAAPDLGPAAQAVAWYQCCTCGWVGSSADLRQSTDQAQILQCMREDQQRGTPGSSSNSSGRKNSTARHQQRTGVSTVWDSGVCTLVHQVGQARTRVIRWGAWSIRVSEREWELLLQLAGGDYPAGLRPHVARVVAQPSTADEVREAFAKLVLEFLSQTS